jgi:hypothetical protein
MPLQPSAAVRGLAAAAVTTGALALAACGSTTMVTVTQTAATARVATAPATGGGTEAPTSSTSTTPTTTQPTAPAPAIVVPKPHIIWDPIPFGAERKEQMVAYARRHYGSFMTPTYKLINPHVIVIHYTETPTYQATFNTFAPDTPDPELHELPNTCAHFVIDKAGGIHQLVPLNIMCRHTVPPRGRAVPAHADALRLQPRRHADLPSPPRDRGRLPHPRCRRLTSSP